MTRIARTRRGALIGAVLGGTWFTADALGAFAAIGRLFHATADGVLLLGIALASAVAASTAAGATLAALVPLRWWPGRSRVLLPSAVVLVVGVATAGYVLRVWRQPVAPPGPRPPVSAARPVPVLWVMLDTLRADTFYGPDVGFDNAPATGAFARDCLVFTDAEAVAGWTIPSLATLMTGLHEVTLETSAGHLPDWTHTVTQHLRAAGYATRAVVDNVLIEPRSGFDTAFESFHQRSAYRFVFSLPSFRVLPVPVREWLRAALRVSDEGSAGVTDAAIAALRDTDHAPLFLYVHYMDPHAPYYPRPELGPEPDDLDSLYFFGTRAALVDDPTQAPSAGQLRTLRYRYDREVRAMDRDLGRLLTAWRERFGHDSLVLITADHGEEFMDHGRLGHGVTVQREMVRVPLVLQLPAAVLPAARRAGRVDAPVAHIDVLPTTLDVLGVTPLPGGPAMQGQSWMPWLRGEEPPPARPILGSHARNGRRVYRYREGAWVVLRTLFDDERSPERTLYDLGDDPTEQHDLSAVRHDVAAPMQARLDRLARQLRTRDRDTGGTNRSREESLRALGYIQ